MPSSNKLRSARRPAERCILVLQGGGALGAYQGGVYEALAGASQTPTWVAGISIGAINAALIAGNPPERRVARLREFWDSVSTLPCGVALPPLPDGIASIGRTRDLLNESNATIAMLFGVAGFFQPRVPAAPFQPPGTLAAISYYDTEPLRRTLEEMVDFDLINSGAVRLSVGAVNVKTGNFLYFDSSERKIDVHHVMASGALPPGFPPVEIDGEFYWDGGLVSNTPLPARSRPARQGSTTGVPGRPLCGARATCRRRWPTSPSARRTSATRAGPASTRRSS